MAVGRAHLGTACCDNTKKKDVDKNYYNKTVTMLFPLIFSHQHLTEYRNSLTAECKSERSNVTVNTPQSVPTDMNNRVYSTPVHLTAENKHGKFDDPMEWILRKMK